MQKSPMKKEFESYSKKNQRRRLWQRVVSMLTCIIVFCTTYALILPAITLTGEATCGLEEHTHKDDCYAQVQTSTLICEPVHVHSTECYDAEQTLICGQADFVLHTHDEFCFDADGKLICGLEKLEEHTHTDECYTLVEQTPAGHVHEDTCYTTEQGELICQREETEGHSHTESCYGEPVLTCGQEETEGHTHSDACRTVTVTCTLEENEEHTHTEECTTATLTCGLEETEGHTHTEACTTAPLTCTLEETEGHQHGTECYEIIETLTCELEEIQETTEADAEPEYILTCTKPEVTAHTHTERCYETRKNEVGEEYTVLICTELEVLEHQHTAECVETTTTRGELICEEEEHVHLLACYSDRTADLETAEIWELTLKDADLSGDAASDLLAIAQTQLGYTESEENYIVLEDGATLKGYTRYGQWDGDPYEDWGETFVEFCLHYAGIGEKVLPRATSDKAWIDVLFQAGYLMDKNYTPQPGDLIFLDIGDENCVGIVSSVDPEGYVTAIFGDYRNEVRKDTFTPNDLGISCYAVLREQEDETLDDVLENIEKEENPSDGNASSTEAADPYEEANTTTQLSLSATMEFILSDGEITGIDTLNEGTSISGSSSALLFSSGVAATSTGIDMTNLITDVTIYHKTTAWGDTWKEIESPALIQKGDLVRFGISYQIPGNTLSASNNSIYYQLPIEGITESKSGIVVDDQGAEVGTYTISESGLITITFYDHYVQENAGGVVIDGTINFDSTAEELDTNNDGKIELEFSDSEKVEIEIEQTIRDDLTVTKTAGTVNDDGTVTYTITVSSKNGTAGNPVELSDWMSNVTYLTGFSVTQTINGDTKDVTDTVTVKPNTGAANVGFDLPSMTAGESYTITYTGVISSVTDGVGTAGNGVTVTSKDKDGNTLTDSADVRVDYNKDILDKTYTLTDDGKVNWTIKVGSADQDLKGWTLSDTINGAALQGNVTLTFPDGTTKEETLPYTFLEGEKGIVTVTYTTSLDYNIGSNSLSNTATLTPPDNNNRPVHSDSQYVQDPNNTGTNWPLNKEANGLSVTGSGDNKQAVVEWSYAINAVLGSVYVSDQYDDTYWYFSDSLQGDQYFTSAQQQELEANLKAAMIAAFNDSAVYNGASWTEENVVYSDSNPQGLYSVEWVSWNGQVRGFKVKVYQNMLKGTHINFSYHTTADIGDGSSQKHFQNQGNLNGKSWDAGGIDYNPVVAKMDGSSNTVSDTEYGIVEMVDSDGNVHLKWRIRVTLPEDSKGVNIIEDIPDTLSLSSLTLSLPNNRGNVSLLVSGAMTVTYDGVEGTVTVSDATDSSGNKKIKIRISDNLIQAFGTNTWDILVDAFASASDLTSAMSDKEYKYTEIYPANEYLSSVSVNLPDTDTQSLTINGETVITYNGQNYTVTTESVSGTQKAVIVKLPDELITALNNNSWSVDVKTNMTTHTFTHTEIGTEISFVELGNNVTVNYDEGESSGLSGSDDHTQKITNEDTSKKLVKSTSGYDSTKNVVPYSLTINPNASDLSEKDTLTIEDRLKFTNEVGKTYFDANLKNVHVYALNEKGEISSELSSASSAEAVTSTSGTFYYTYVQSQEFLWNGNQWYEVYNDVVFTVPDNTRLLITYEYFVSGVEGQYTSFENYASIREVVQEGESSNRQWFAIDESDATAELNSINVYKVDKDNFNKLLPGAKFELYKWNDSTSVWEFDHIVESNDSSSLQLIGLEINQAYYLVETKAPSGYILDQSKHYFMIFDSAKSYVYAPDDFPSSAYYTKGRSIYITNEKDGVEISAEKQWQDSDGNSISAPNTNSTATVELVKVWSRYPHDFDTATIGNSATVSLGFGKYSSDTDKFGPVSIPTHIGDIIYITLKTPDNDTMSRVKVWNETSQTYEWQDQLMDYPAGLMEITSTANNHLPYTKTQNADGTYTYVFSYLVKDTSATLRGWVYPENMDGSEITYSIASYTSLSATNTREEVIGTYTFSAANGWSTTWSNLPEYELDIDTDSANGIGRIVGYYSYYIRETGVTNADGFSPSYSTDSDGSLIVTNKQIETTDVTVTKKWFMPDGVTNLANPTVDSVSFYLLRNGVKVDRNGDGSITDADAYTITSTDWTITITGLPKKDSNGTDYQYTVEEISVDGYHTSYSTDTLTISNTQIEKIDVTVRKEWYVGGSVVTDASAYPAVEVKLYRITSTTANSTDGTVEEIGTYTLSYSNDSNSENDWIQTVTGLPKTGEDADGNKLYYTYYFEETEISGYTITYSSDGSNFQSASPNMTATGTTTIRNTDNGKISLEVEKKWVDSSNKEIDDPPTDSITFELFKWGTTSGSTDGEDDGESGDNTGGNTGGTSGGNTGTTLYSISADVQMGNGTSLLDSVFTGSYEEGKYIKLEYVSYWKERHYGNITIKYSDGSTSVISAEDASQTKITDLGFAIAYCYTYYVRITDHLSVVANTATSESKDSYQIADGVCINDCSVSIVDSVANATVSLASDDGNSTEGWLSLGTYELTSANDWKLLISNLEKGQYKIAEVSGGYTVTYSIGGTDITSDGVGLTGSLSSNTSAVITNKVDAETTNLPVNKLWFTSDGTAITGTDVTFESISFKVIMTWTENGVSKIAYYDKDGDGNTENDADDVYTVTKAENWSTIVYGLPVKDANGNVYTYSVEEVPVENFEASYETIDGVLTIKNTSTLIDIPVSKKWFASDGSESIPTDITSISFYILQNDSRYDANADGSITEADLYTISSENGWATVVTGLPQKDANNNLYTYTIQEVKVGEKTVDESGYKVEYTTDTDGNLVINNTKLISISVSKQWIGPAPDYLDRSEYAPQDSIQFNLYKDGVQIDADPTTTDVVDPFVITKDDGWMITIDNLEPGTYRVEEITTDYLKGYVSYSYSSSSGGAAGDTATFAGGVTDAAFSITNSPFMNVTLDKGWPEGTTPLDGLKIEVQLYRYKSTTLEPQTFSLDNLQSLLDEGIIELARTHTDILSGNFHKTFKNLPLYGYEDLNGVSTLYYYSYFVLEATEGYDPVYSIVDSSGNLTTLSQTGSMTITNDSTSIQVTKTWVDESGNALTDVPSSITFQIIQTANGQSMVYCPDPTITDQATRDAYTFTLSASDGWTKVFSGLPLTAKVDGVLYPCTYTVQEITVDGYDTKIDNSTVTEGERTTYKSDITNLSKGSTSISVEKVWDTNADTAVQVQLYQFENVATDTNKDGVIDANDIPTNVGEGGTVDKSNWVPTLSFVDGIFNEKVTDSEGNESLNISGAYDPFIRSQDEVTTTEVSNSNGTTTFTLTWNVPDGQKAEGAITLNIAVLDYYAVGSVASVSNVKIFIDGTERSDLAISYIGKSWDNSIKNWGDDLLIEWYNVYNSDNTCNNDIEISNTLSVMFTIANRVASTDYDEYTTNVTPEYLVANNTKVVTNSGTYIPYTSDINTGSNLNANNYVVLSNNNAWKHTWIDLPLYGYNESGQLVYYTYYALEISESEDWYPSYSVVDPVTSGIIGITNNDTPEYEEPGYELPSTGGLGTFQYTLGGVVLCMAAVLMYIHKKGRKGARTP